MSYGHGSKREELSYQLELLREKLAEMPDDEKFKTIISLFGRRGKKAVRNVKDNVKVLKLKNRDVYVVHGKQLDYTLIDFGYCSCEDFYVNNVLRGLGIPCYHVLTLLLLQSMGKQMPEVDVRELFRMPNDRAGSALPVKGPCKACSLTESLTRMGLTSGFGMGPGISPPAMTGRT